MGKILPNFLKSEWKEEIWGMYGSVMVILRVYDAGITDLSVCKARVLRFPILWHTYEYLCQHLANIWAFPLFCILTSWLNLENITHRNSIHTANTEVLKSTPRTTVLPNKQCAKEIQQDCVYTGVNFQWCRMWCHM